MSAYPTRENMDDLLDEYIKVRTRLEIVLLSLETEDGIFTFPDGEVMNAGIKVSEPV